MKKYKEKTYTIVALVCGNEVFIGKTASRRISALYHRHCRGEMFATRHWAELGVKPRLHVLFRDEMKDYEAYRKIVAYVYYFGTAGFEVLNSLRTIKNADSLHSETQRLVDEIQKEPSDQLLARTLITKPSAADIRYTTEEKICLTPADQKLTIRLSEWEKNRFDELAESLHLSQRQTIQYLISKKNMHDGIFPPWDEDFYVRAMMGALREENEKLRTENEKLEVYRKSEKPHFDDLRTALSLYFGILESANPISLSIERGRYKNYPNVQEYRYPDQPGLFLVRPTAILTGKGPYAAKFVVALATNGTRLKFRFYPKATFAGVQPNDKKYAVRGSMWLLGCEKAMDGAMDLIFAFPLDVRYANYATKTSNSTAQDLLAKILGCDTTDEC